MKSKSCNKELEKNENGDIKRLFPFVMVYLNQNSTMLKNESMEHKLSVQHLLTLLINVNEPLDTANAFF